MRAARILIAVLALLCSRGAAVHAQAAPSAGPSFSWVRLPGAEGCIAQAELAAQVEARIGRAVFVRPADALVLVEGRIGASAQGGFEAVIAVADRDGQLLGERALALAGSDCRALDDVVALVIAVTLRGSANGGVPLPDAISAQLEALFGDEPSTLDPSALPSAARAGEQAAEPATPRDQPGRVPAAGPTPAEPAPFGVALDAGMAVATGLQSDGTLAPSARADFVYRELVSLALAGGIGIAQQQAVDDRSSSERDGTLNTSLWYASLSACALPGQVLGGRLALCARVAFGRLHAETDDFLVRDGEKEYSFSELGPEASLRLPVLAPLHVRLAVGLPVRLGRRDIVYVQRDGRTASAFEVTGVGLTGELALGVSLP